MIDTDKLRGKIAEKGYSQYEVAEKLGIAPKTFYNKMKIGVFDSDEMYSLVKLLDITDPTKIFFAD